MSKKSGLIVIQRIQRGHAAGHHGGSWKVAFADFAIAMMALFMLLWILSSTDEDQKSAIASYFENPGAFRETSSPNPIDFGGRNSMLDTPVPGPNLKGNEGAEIIGEGNAQSLNRMPEFKELADQLQQIIGGKARDGLYANAMYFELLPEGLRIVILDDQSHSMFARGSANLNNFYQDLLLVLAPVLSKIEQSLMISGHTDSSLYSGSNYSNWQLSSSRAEIARKTLVAGGVDDMQIMMVLGMADRVLRDSENPGSSSNRRIEILVLTKEMELRMRRLLAPVADKIANSPDTFTEIHSDMESTIEAALRNSQPYESIE